MLLFEALSQQNNTVSVLSLAFAVLSFSLPSLNRALPGKCSLSEVWESFVPGIIALGHHTEGLGVGLADFCRSLQHRTFYDFMISMNLREALSALQVSFDVCPQDNIILHSALSPQAL